MRNLLIRPAPRRLSDLQARCCEKSMPTTMQCFNGGQSPMGRDTDSKWVQWLALSRRNNPGSTFATSPSSSSPSSPYKGSSTRSSATSYFALLSAKEDGSNHGRSSFANHKQHGHVSGSTTHDIEPSWVTRPSERWHQGQLSDMPDQITREKSNGSERSFLNIDKILSPTETQQLQMQRYNLPQDPENAVELSTATTTASAVSISVGATSPLPSPLDPLWDSEIDSLGTELLSNLCSVLPIDPIDTQEKEAAGPCATVGLDDGDFTWLEGQHAFAFNMSGDLGELNPGGKRGYEEYPGGHTNDGQIHLESVTNKKQKFSHPWTSRLETSSSFSF